MRIYDEGVYRDDIVRLIVSNTRAPSDAEGDCLPPAGRGHRGRRARDPPPLREVRRGDDRHRVFDEVQTAVERLTRKRISELLDGTWETEDYIDYDLAEPEGSS